MASLLDARSQPIDRTKEVRVNAYLTAKDDEDRRRAAEEQAIALNEQRIAENEQKQLLPVATADVLQWTAQPEYQKPWAQQPQEMRDHLISAYGPGIAAQAPALVNKAVGDNTGKIPGLDDELEVSGAVDDGSGNLRKSYVRREKITPQGLTFKTTADAEAAGHNPEGAVQNADGSITITKVARDDISRRKLGVNEKNALTGALTAATSLDNIEADFDALNKANLTGPVRGRFEELKQTMGVGNQQFSEFSAQAKANLFNLARSLQGAGVLTEQDVTRMESIAPTAKTTQEQFKGQLSGVRKIMAEKMKAWKVANDESLSPEQRAQVDTIITGIEGRTGKTLPPAANGSAPAAPELPTINTQSEYDALPKGAQYRDSNGKAATKR